MGAHKLLGLFDWWRGNNERVFAKPTLVGAPVATHGTSGATSVAAALPAVSGGILAGDLIVGYASSVLAEIIPNGPTGFKRHKMTNGNNGSNGSDVGGRLASAWSKEAVGGESGTLTFNLPEPAESPAVTSVSSISVVLEVWRKTGVGSKWNVFCVDAVHRIVNEGATAPTALVCTSMNKQDLRPRDQVRIFNTANIDALTFTPRSCTFGVGLTSATVTENLLSSGTTSGNDSYLFMSSYEILTGRKTDFITYNATAVGTVTQRAPWLSTIMMTIRVTASDAPYLPSGYDFIDPACITDSTPDTRQGIWGKMVRAFEGTGVTYGREDYLGVPHFYIKNDFTDYLTVANRRGEIVKTQFPMKYLPASKYFQGLRYRFPALPAFPDQIIIWQCHPGSGGLPSSNHPIAYLEVCKAGMYPGGIQGYPSGSPPAGTLIVVIGMSRTVGSTASVRKYIAIPSINFIGNNIDVPIELMMQFNIAGQGRFILNSGGVNLVDETAYATMAQDPIELGNDTPGTGSVANVGAGGKAGMYLHQLDTFGAVSHAKNYRDAFVAAGLTPEIKHYAAGFKEAIKTTTDVDYDDAYNSATLQSMIVY